MLYAAFCIAKGRILQCERRSIARRFTVNCNADFIFPHFTVICRIFSRQLVMQPLISKVPIVLPDKPIRLAL